MPMIDIQRRHQEVYRIRLGDRINGGPPRKLTDSIRITSRNEQIVHAFTEVYGGTVQPWEGQHEAYLPTTALRILVLPGQSVTQWWELYQGSVCVRRCDGYQEQKSGKRCMCPEDIQERVNDTKSCAPTTRLNVICPDVAVVGAGGLVTHGLIAAETLPQSIAVAEAALRRGIMVPAILRVVENKTGRNHFIYPQIEIIGTSVDQLTTGEVRLPHAIETATPELEATVHHLTPVPKELPQWPTSSIAEQVAQVDQEPRRPQRANAAQPLPPTGLKPRTAQQAAADAEPTAEEPRPQSSTQLKKMQILFKQRGIEGHDARVQFASTAVGRDLKSTADMTLDETGKVIDYLERGPQQQTLGDAG